MTANQTQIGGTHYKDMRIQPWDYMRECMSADGFAGYLQGCCIKYLSRFHRKGGVEDLRKARHYLDKLIETLDPPFAVTLDKSIRDSLLDKYKDGVPAEQAVPHKSTMPIWVICDAAGNPISWPPAGPVSPGHVDVTRVAAPDPWPGPDWSQAPDGAVAWSADESRTADWWVGVGTPEVVGVAWLGRGGIRPVRAPSFNYTGDWRESLRKRPA